MKKIHFPFIMVCLLALVISAVALQLPFKQNSQPLITSYPGINRPEASAPKIQVAILLDVSNSMDGLIDQAKAQLWNMVSIMGNANCDGIAPKIEIALYEYGRPANGIQKGYIRQISNFTGNLDELSKKLFSLSTDGGDEYCGQVIETSLQELKWDTSAISYKVIFIAGNEDFLQGAIQFTKGCSLASGKGVIVNTIFCGDRQEGIRQHWNLGSECGKGSYSNINQDASIDDIATPYDSAIFSLNEKLNGTYLTYGYNGAAAYETQSSVDRMNAGYSKKAGLKRAEVKSKSKLYNNEAWDMVDASRSDSAFISKVELKTLPDSLRNKTRAELKDIVQKISLQRQELQGRIVALSAQRESYISEQKTKSTPTEATLETEIEKIIKEQARRFRMVIM